eukprot:scaffold10016_cov170-Amphora_coffeaeformis.AAC.10
MLEGNGISGSIDGRVFATTQSGSLWILSPLEEESDPKVFTPPNWVDEATGDALDLVCRSSVVLKETPTGGLLYAVYVVIDLDPATGQPVQSRVMGISPNDGSMLWFIVLDGSVAEGSPAIGQDFIYVVHNTIANEEGRLSLIRVVPSNSLYVANVADTILSTEAPWAPPSVSVFPASIESPWDEVVVWGDSYDNGRSEIGSTYLLKVGNGGVVRSFETLSESSGSTITAPTLGSIQALNGVYDWNIATGNYGGLFQVWDQTNWDQILGGTTQVGGNLNPDWTETATSFTSGVSPLRVSPVFSASETFIFVAGAEGGLSAWGLQRARLQWELPTLIHVSQPVLYVPLSQENNNPSVLYACDATGNIRQIEANNRGNLNWSVNYCEENSLITCPGVSADILISRNGNRLFVANEQGSVFGMRVAEFDTPAPTIVTTDPPTGVPTKAPVVAPTTAPTVFVPPEETPVDPSRDAPTEGESPNLPIGEPAATLAPSGSPTKLPRVTDDSRADVSESKSNSGGLYIVLTVVILTLVMCVAGAAVIIKRRRRSKESREIEDEMAAVRRWKSNKKMYEEEMKAEEEATMQELSSGSPRKASFPPVVAAEAEKAALQKAEPLITPRVKERRARSRSTSRTRASSNTPGTLGSISESVDEEIASPASMDSESVEVTVEDLEESVSGSLSRNLAIAFATEDTMKDAKSVDAKSVAVKRTESPAEDLLNEPDEKMVQPNSGSAGKHSQESASEKKSSSSAEESKSVSQYVSEFLSLNSETASQSNRAEPRRLDSKSSSSTYLQDDDKSEMNSTVSGNTDEPGRIRAYVPPPGTSPPDIHTDLSTDDDRTDVTSLLSGVSARSGLTDEPGAIKTQPRRVQYLPGSPVDSDLMSVDSSLYLDDNAATSPVPPADPISILQPIVTPTSLPSPPKRLDPPDGASVIGSPLSRDEDSDLAAAVGIMLPAMPCTSNSHSTEKRSNSKERVGTALAKVNTRMRPYNAPRENLYTKPVVMEGNPQPRGRTRAGLFSRRERSDNPNENRPSASDQPSSGVTPSAPAASHSQEDLKIVGTASSRKDKKKKSKPKENAEQADGSNPWNSFLNQLAKVEEEFFNPTMPQTKKDPKPVSKPALKPAKRQYGRTTSSKQSVPPPPPPSHPDNDFNNGDNDSEAAQGSTSSKYR